MACDRNVSRVSFEIEDWSAVKARAKWNTLLLGNGASISIDSRFNYRSLYERAKEAGRLTAMQRVFESFETVDFELVLQACLHASRVNAALGLPDSEITSAYRKIRDALIETVHDVHPRQHEVDLAKLDAAAAFVSNFARVVTLNYDLTLYWVLMRLINTTNGALDVRDAFLPGGFAPDKIEENALMFFYPHGALFLVRDLLGRESKLLRSEDTDLLETIAIKCNGGEHSPVFVSEGTSVAKRHAIGRSAYLSYVYEKVLPDLGNTVAYGLSFDLKDDHILQAMSNSPPQHMAVSVFSGATAADQQEYCQRVVNQIDRRCPRTRITFFRSDGPGCWCNPTD